MATIKEAMATAINEARAGKPAALGKMVDRLRFNPPKPCAPFDYNDTLALAERAVPGLTRAEWDELLYTVDSNEGREG